MPEFDVVKRNQRLCVVDAATGVTIYSPPDFLRPYLRNRETLRRLAERLTAGANLAEAVCAFETEARPCQHRET